MIPRKHSVWKHHNGCLYRVLCVARDEYRQMDLVIHENLNGGIVYARPLDDFLGTLATDDTVPRFTEISK